MQPLPERISSDELPQFRNDFCVRAQMQIRLYADLDGLQPHLLEPKGILHCQQFGRHVR
jgi:hypothetical protein